MEQMIDTNYMDDLIEGAGDPWNIENDRMADWAVERVLEAVAERDRLTLIADDRIKELQAQKSELAQKCNRTTQFLSDKLYQYFQTVKPAETKTQKTYKLLAGKLVLKHQQPEYVRDEAAMIPWVEKNVPEYVRVQKSINWSELKKRTEVQGEKVVLSETGELVPGVVAWAREDVFEVSK